MHRLVATVTHLDAGAHTEESATPRLAAEKSFGCQEVCTGRVLNFGWQNSIFPAA